MCRDGFTTACKTDDCGNVVTCRDNLGFCAECWALFMRMLDPEDEVL